MAVNQQHVIMVASENDALIGGKVGGVGDVIRSLPYALAQSGCRVTVIVPSYGFLHTQNPSRLAATIRFPFHGEQYEGNVFSVTAKEQHAGVEHVVIDHPELLGDPIYFNDPSASPFKRDAEKYALFCSAAGQYLSKLNGPFILHLHDWHTGVLLFLRELHPDFIFLQKTKTVFTIHNLAIQGTRPMFGKESSPEQWFPELFTDDTWTAQWIDHRYKELCFNPMAAGIRCAGKVNTVSPTYAEEILRQDNPRNGDHGGEGLEGLLQKAKSEQQLFGILNGCDYPEERIIPRLSTQALLQLLSEEINTLKSKSPHYNTDVLLKRIELLQANQPAIILSSVTRVVEQKTGLLFERCSNGNIAADEIMAMLKARNGIYIILGNGNADSEQQIEELAKRHQQVLFVKGYSEKLSKALYANGNLFLMPSLFEPCGISQMLAMRDGQPCLVNSVGGLRDTVMNGVNGFAFYGVTMQERADNFVATAKRAIDIFFQQKLLWEKIAIEAAKARFTWEQSARQYIQQLYS